MSCKFCSRPEPMQVSGGGRYARAVVDPAGRCVRVTDGCAELRVRVKRCPMCGRKLTEEETR